MVVSQTKSLRGFRFDGSHDEAMTPVGGKCEYHVGHIDLVSDK